MSPALMGLCAEKGIQVSFLSPNGKFLARIQGKVTGNIYLREEQFKRFSDPIDAMSVARNCIYAKVLNSRASLYRFKRDHQLSIDTSLFNDKTEKLKECLLRIKIVETADELRIIEAEAARYYFSVFDQMILNRKGFSFSKRSRRPPLDNVNALLSFAYSLLAGMIVGALESVGLDPYYGIFHVPRPGRASLALDLIEELRPVYADRFVISLINRRILKDSDFNHTESGAVTLTDTGRKIFLSEWQKKKKEVITHPYTEEKVEWGLIPFVQAMLLAKYLRNEINGYPPFIWK